MFQLFAFILILIDKFQENLAADSRLTTEGNAQCTDFSGRIYQSGMHYMPGPDTCNLCICHNGQPKGCKLVLCSAPTECKSFQLGNNCCEYVCLDDTFAERTTDFVASGITATLSLSLLFFLVNRLRQRKIRGRETRHQNSSDVVGSIGYITGNMGYMEGNLTGMDYGYGNAQHYPLWKPPSSYFPRGEAPPPYEEAIALSQAEALSAAAAQCTVSVATTRSLPITLNQQQQQENDLHHHMIQQTQQQQQQQQTQQQLNQQQHSITTSTTNLINININSGGNLTQVATGENHQPPYSIAEASTQQQLPQQQFRQAAICVQATPIQQSQNIIQPGISMMSQIQPHYQQNYQSALLQQQQHQQHQQQQIQTVECSYKNCTLNSSNGSSTSATSSSSKILSSSKSHRITAPDTITQYNATLSAATTAAAATSASADTISSSESKHEQNKYSQVLPPPLFDSQSDGSKTPRRHRTIPRNFANAVDSALSQSASNILDAGQQQQQSITPTSKKPQCQCPIQHVPMSYMGVSQLSSSQQANGNIFLSTLTTKLTSPSGKNGSYNKIGESHSNNSTMKRHSSHAQNKILTISKQVGEMQQQQQQLHQHQTSSRLLKLRSPQINVENETQFLQSLQNENNPVLPPKMHKHYGNLKPKLNQQHHLKHQLPTTLNLKPHSKIHTISKDLIVQEHPTPHRIRSIQSGYSTKSLPRQYKDDKSTPVLTLPPSSPHDKQQQPFNCNSNNTGINKQTTINSSTFYPTMIQSVTYTLPKNHSKSSLNNQIANVVSKVPSVIMIGHHHQQHQQQQHNFSKAVASMSSQLESASFSMINSHPHVTESQKFVNNNNCVSNNNNNNNNNNKPNDCSKRSTLPKTVKQSQNTTVPYDDSNKSLPVCTTSKNCSNPNQHFLPNDTSLDDDYLSECENCKIANSSKYYLTIDEDAMKQETQTLQRNKYDEDERKSENGYYRTSSTLPTNTKKTTNIKNTRETWFPSIQGSSESSDEEVNE